MCVHVCISKGHPDAFTVCQINVFVLVLNI